MLEPRVESQSPSRLAPDAGAEPAARKPFVSPAVTDLGGLSVLTREVGGSL